MKKHFFIVLAGIMLWSTAVYLTACKKTSSVEDTGFATEHATAEQTFSDILDITDQASESNSLSTFKTTSQCATITRDTIAVPHTITINFGTTNCLCSDGKYRRGIILVSYTGKYKDSGSIHTITFSNYFVNNNQVIGTKTVTNMGLNANNQIYCTVNTNASIILASGAGTIQVSGSKTRTWITGYATTTKTDDSYNVTGSWIVTRPNGTQVTHLITKGLSIARSCNWIKEGAVQVTVPNGTIRIIDYGNGACDNQATLTNNGVVTTITLP